MFRLSSFRIVLCFISLPLLAVFLVPGLVTRLKPQKEGRYLTVSFSYSGSNPLIVESKVTAVIENACSGINNLKHIKSKSGYNSGSVELYYDNGADLQVKRFELAALIRQLYPGLPPGVSYPEISGAGGKEKPLLLQYTVNAALQPFEIKQRINRLFQKSLLSVPGIDEVRISGAESRQVSVLLKKEPCQLLHLDANGVLNSIQSGFTGQFPGAVNTKDGYYFLCIPAAAADIASIENMIVAHPASKTIRVKDIAQVYIEESNPAEFFRVNGKNAITVNVYSNGLVNEIALTGQCKQQVDILSKQLPAGFEVRLNTDNSEQLLTELQKSNKRILLSFLFLSIMVLLSTRSFRYLLNILLGLFIATAVTIILAYLCKIDLNYYAIAGMAVSIGMMIENIAVVSHHCRYKGTAVFPPLLCTTFLSVSALTLFYFLPTEETRDLTSLSVIILLATIASFLVAVFFTPKLYQLSFANYRSGRTLSSFRQRKLKYRVVNFYNRLLNVLGKRKRWCMVLVVLGFGLPVFLLPEKWEGDKWYHNWYNSTLGDEEYQVTYRPVVDKITGGVLRLFMNEVEDNAGYRDPEKKQLTVTAELPYGHTPDQMNEMLHGLEQYLAQFKRIEEYTTRVSNGQSGSIEIRFNKKTEYADFAFALRNALVKKSLEWSGVEWHIFGIGDEFSNSEKVDLPGYKIKLTGYNYDEVEKLAQQFAEKLMQNQRIKTVNTNERFDINEKSSIGYNMTLDAQKLAEQGVYRYQVSNMLQQLSRPNELPAKVTIDHHSMPVVIKEQKASPAVYYDVINNPLQIANDRTVRLRSVARLNENARINSIYKDNRQYLRLVSYEYRGSQKAGDDYLNGLLSEMRGQLPLGFTIDKFEDQPVLINPDKYYLLFVFVLLTFLACSILFEDLRYPFVVLFMGPVSLIGIFLAFSWGHYYFDQGAFASFILVMSMVSNSTIFIINGLPGRRKKNLTQHASLNNRKLVKAIVNRSKTILLISVATCCGLIPFLFDGTNEVFWFPLAVGTIGGIVFSFVALFLVLPVLLWTNK